MSKPDVNIDKLVKEAREGKKIIYVAHNPKPFIKQLQDHLNATITLQPDGTADIILGKGRITITPPSYATEVPKGGSLMICDDKPFSNKQTESILKTLMEHQKLYWDEVQGKEHCWVQAGGKPC